MRIIYVIFIKQYHSTSLVEHCTVSNGIYNQTNFLYNQNTAINSQDTIFCAFCRLRSILMVPMLYAHIFNMYTFKHPKKRAKIYFKN